MRKLTRFKNLIIGVIMIVFALLLLIWPDYGTPAIMLVVGLALLIYGIYCLVFFGTRAVHMVGGKRIFYRGILLLDLGVFMLAAYKGSERLVFWYLMLLLAATGSIDLIRALDFRKAGAPWKVRAIVGAACIIVLFVALIYRKNPQTLVYIFCIALTISAISKIASVFRKTAVIYIPE